MNLAEIWTAIDEGRHADAERLLHDDPDLLASRAGQMAHGYILAHTGRHPEARDVYARLRAAHAGDEWEHIAVHQQGMVERLAGDHAAALAHFEQELQLIRALGDRPHKLAVNAYELGVTSLALGRVEAARTHLQDSLRNAHRQDDPVAVACAERGLGEVAAYEGNVGEARAHYARAIEAFEDAEDEVGIREVQALMDALKVHEA
ncbi:tetratricopeptide repeat protein [Deinococcus maricopensis]|uniref:Tetratricopeptide repeat protein n=1 Tax=Deinococcus maricopensis (strain DSM 21211 / LMG 22137 / NRRL B-23946 / LB-34) TaxID=709986 RepID=E8U6H6_DEIML|nr:tetratricopeptide repeat protein [Deinococcus maricopensis]ADV66665.1 hypothetical protein Deima_1012 [Deinococcus maricopensis DSM 21211]